MAAGGGEPEEGEIWSQLTGTGDVDGVEHVIFGLECYEGKYQLLVAGTMGAVQSEDIEEMSKVTRETDTGGWNAALGKYWVPGKEELTVWVQERLETRKRKSSPCPKRERNSKRRSRALTPRSRQANELVAQRRPPPPENACRLDTRPPLGLLS